jgi:undecaprenyl-diphosphatase
MGLIEAFILGVVEGFSEFLPISSTGHLILTARLLGLTPGNFLKSFEIAIQCGAILAVVVLYWRDLMINRLVLARVICAFIPTGMVGFFLYKLVKNYLLESANVVLGALALGGLAIIVMEYLFGRKGGKVKKMEDISYGQAFLIGVFQSLAVIPGVSRSAATILGGLSLGIERKTIVEFSFVLAIPTMIAATGYDLSKNIQYFTLGELKALCVGLGVSFMVAWLSIKFLLRFIQTHTFLPFGLYRILLCLAWVLFV